MLRSGKIYCSSSLPDLDNRLSICEPKATPSQINDHQSRGIHFFIGDPPLNPPTVRGSVLLRLNPQFLLDNSANFIVGRPVDLDGVKFGHLPVLPSNLSPENLELDRTEFIRLCQRLTMLAPAELTHFLSRRASAPALNILKGIIPTSLIEYMQNTESFHAKVFEYELTEDYILRHWHVTSLYIPTAYANTMIANSLSARLGTKFKLYNPKYGIEELRA